MSFDRPPAQQIVSTQILLDIIHNAYVAEDSWGITVSHLQNALQLAMYYGAMLVHAHPFLRSVVISRTMRFLYTMLTCSSYVQHDPLKSGMQLSAARGGELPT